MLNTHAGILEVMGAPLSGTSLRAYVMSGGGVTLKKFKPRLRSNRFFLIFPIRGSERTGLVSVEVKKKRGQVCLSSCFPSYSSGLMNSVRSSHSLNPCNFTCIKKKLQVLDRVLTYYGHTELFQHFSNSPSYGMYIASKGHRIVQTKNHYSLINSGNIC